jgi:hypothetical protein
MRKIILLASVSFLTVYNIACTTVNITPNPSASPTATATMTPVPTPFPTVAPTPTPVPTSSSSTDYNYLIERAMKIPEISECLTRAHNPNEEINGSVEVTGICLVKGYTKKVTFTAKPKCNDGEACPLYLRLVATVEFDCEDNVTKAECL